jgi:hypothetical protein
MLLNGNFYLLKRNFSVVSRSIDITAYLNTPGQEKVEIIDVLKINEIAFTGFLRADK